MGDQEESVRQEGQLGQNTVKLVVDQRPALAVAEIGLVFDLEFRADVVAAHPVGVVDRVENDGLERMLALGDFAAGGQQLFPAPDGDLEDIQRIQPRFGGEKQRAFGPGTPGRFADLARAVYQHREIGVILLGGTFLRRQHVGSPFLWGLKKPKPLRTRSRPAALRAGGLCGKSSR